MLAFLAASALAAGLAYMILNGMVEVKDFDAKDREGQLRTVLDISCVTCWSLLGFISMLMWSIAPFHVGKNCSPRQQLMRRRNMCICPKTWWLWLVYTIIVTALIVMLALCITRVAKHDYAIDKHADAQVIFSLIYYVFGIVPTNLFAIYTLGYMEMLIHRARPDINTHDMVHISAPIKLPPYWSFWIYYMIATIALWSLSYSVYLWTHVYLYEELGMAVCPAAIVVAYIAGVARVNQKMIDIYAENFQHRMQNGQEQRFDYELVALYDPNTRKRKMFRLFGCPVTPYHSAIVFIAAFFFPALVRLFQYIFVY